MLSIVRAICDQSVFKMFFVHLYFLDVLRGFDRVTVNRGILTVKTRLCFPFRAVMN